VHAFVCLLSLCRENHSGSRKQSRQRIGSCKLDSSLLYDAFFRPGRIGFSLDAKRGYFRPSRGNQKQRRKELHFWVELWVGAFLRFEYELKTSQAVKGTAIWIAVEAAKIGRCGWISPLARQPLKSSSLASAPGKGSGVHFSLDPEAKQPIRATHEVQEPLRFSGS